jgi:4-hydroxy-tetrahydrodipicolinate synthase
MVRLLAEGDRPAAEKLLNDLSPLYNMVTVKTNETTAYGEVVCRARNPLPYKSLMALLGMPAGGCRRPLGRMSSQGLHEVVEAAKSVHRRNPSILAPVEAFFGVDIDARLDDPSLLEGLCYPEYA